MPQQSLQPSLRKSTSTLDQQGVMPIYYRVTSTSSCLDHPIGPVTIDPASLPEVGGKVQGEVNKRATPATLAGFQPTDLSSACLCLGVPTPSTTVTLTAAKTVTVLTTTVVSIFPYAQSLEFN